MAKTNQFKNTYYSLDFGDNSLFNYYDSDLNTGKLTYYFSDKTQIGGLIPLANASWQAYYNTYDYGFKYNNQSTTLKLVPRGYSPRFKKSLFYKDDPGTYYLYRTDDYILITDKNDKQLEKHVKADFDEGVVPHRVIFILQGAGGAGGYDSSDEMWPEKDTSGAGGGGGACLGCVIDLDNTYGYWIINVGAGGDQYPNAWNESIPNKQDGKPTSVVRVLRRDPWTQVVASAGGGGFGGWFSGGKGGVPELSDDRSVVWPLPCYDSGGTFYTSSMLYGAVGGTGDGWQGGNGNGAGTGSYTFTITSDSNYSSKNYNYKPTGGKSGGSYGYKPDWAGGGGASYYANGGNGGGAGSTGGTGSRGSGGAGAPSTAFANPMGGAGGNGVIEIFY